MKPEIIDISTKLNASLAPSPERYRECEKTGHAYQAGLCLACGYWAGNGPPLAPITEADKAWARDVIGGWPDPSSVSVGPKGYMTPAGGPFTRVTRVCDVVDAGKSEGLIRWAAGLEHDAALEAAAKIFTGPDPGGAEEFIAAADALMGETREHQKVLAKAGDIGTAAHQLCRWKVDGEVGPQPVVPDASLWAFMAFDDWFKDSGLKVVRSEQPVWDETLGIAGTIDYVMDDTKGIFGGGLGVLDLKTSKGLYSSHHMQVGGAYLAMGRRWAPLNWAALVRLPKVATDPNTEVKQAGDMRYDYLGKNGRRYKGGHQLTYQQLWDSFKAALTIHRLIVEGRDA